MRYTTTQRHESMSGWSLAVYDDACERAGQLSTYDSSVRAHVELATLRVYTPFRRQGYGTMLMHRVLELYAAEPRDIHLTVVPYRSDDGRTGMSRDQLFEWYARFGFERAEQEFRRNLMVRGSTCRSSSPTLKTLA